MQRRWIALLALSRSAVAALQCLISLSRSSGLRAVVGVISIGGALRIPVVQNYAYRTSVVLCQLAAGHDGLVARRVASSDDHDYTVRDTAEHPRVRHIQNRRRIDITKSYRFLSRANKTGIALEKSRFGNGLKDLPLGRICRFGIPLSHRLSSAALSSTECDRRISIRPSLLSRLKMWCKRG